VQKCRHIEVIIIIKTVFNVFSYTLSRELIKTGASEERSVHGNGCQGLFLAPNSQIRVL